ncbi:hypothetical protein GE21DRAFT_1290842 [Neurospora crassa]|nr:hypothetical protein GE21DRAFT_1290842 [Neurospora crassa]
MAHCACSCTFWRWFRGSGQAVWRLAVIAAAHWTIFAAGDSPRLPSLARKASTSSEYTTKILGGHGSSACFPPLIDSQPSQRSVSGVGLLRYGCLKVVRVVIWPVPTVHFCACHQS